MSIALPARAGNFTHEPAPATSLASGFGMSVEARVLPSVAAIARADWDRLFPGAAEGWDYFRACELAKPEGFTSAAIGAFAGDTLVAAAPLFRLDMLLPDVLRPVGDWLNRHTPRLVNKPVLGMGSPLTEECPIGLLPSLNTHERADAFAALLRGTSEHARAERVSVLALKDVTDRDDQWARDPLERAGFVGVPTLPVATLHLAFKDEAEYLATFSYNLRKDMRRKMKSPARVQVEVRDQAGDVADEIVALFQETKAKRKADHAEFDEVPDDYFRQVVETAAGRSSC